MGRTSFDHAVVVVVAAAVVVVVAAVVVAAVADVGEDSSLEPQSCKKIEILLVCIIIGKL